MRVLQQADGHTGELPENASFEAENCLALLDLAPEYMTTGDLQQTWTPMLEATPSDCQETGHLDLSTYTFPQDFQPPETGIFNTTRDPPMSFRDRHRFLDGVYNSCPDPARMLAEDMGEVARKAGLLMEEVLSWFKDEKSRRVKLLANDPPHQAPKSTCQFPPSPESIRGTGDSSASSSYNATSPGTPSKPQDTSSPFSASAEQKIPAPPKAKRGRPAKTHIKIEADIASPDSKRTKISVKYPCPDCKNFVPVERWAEHINRKHFPKQVWECPKTNRQTGKYCSSSSHYRPAYREDNFVTHLKGEHNCPDTEVTELKKTCKFEVTGFFHKICGFCEKPLSSRDESIEHIKDHFRKAAEEQDPSLDLGVSLWKEKCGVEHKLQLGIHYRRSQASEADPTDESDNHDCDEDDNGGSRDGSSNNSEFRSDNNSDGRGSDGGRESADGSPGDSCRDNPTYQTNNHICTHDHDVDSRSSQHDSDNSGDPQSTDATPCQEQTIGQAKTHSENVLELPSISLLLGCFYDKYQEGQNRDRSSLQAPESPTGTTPMTPQRLTAQEDAKYQCQVEGCGMLFSQRNFKGHLEMHDETREHLFLCGVKKCAKKFDKKADMERHQNIHEVQRNRCEHCSQMFARQEELKRHLANGCCSETSVGVSIADHTCHMLSRHVGYCKEEGDFNFHPNLGTIFEVPNTRELYPKSTSSTSSAMYHEAPQYTTESLEFLDPSNYSSPSGASARSSAFDSPFSIPTPQYNMWTPNFPASSKNSVVSGLSAASSSLIGSPHSIHGHIFPGPEFGLGLTPRIASYDNFGPHDEYTSSYGGLDDVAFDFNPSKLNSNHFVDPLILHPQYPAPVARSNHSPYRCPPSSQTSGQSQACPAGFSSEESMENGRSKCSECGKIFQDVKAHILTHQKERPEKCPIQTCDYHIKGFARKYDKNRHTLTHYKGKMVCGFCPGGGSIAEKSFNRADVFKRHLTSVHGVEQTPPNSRKKTAGNINSGKNLSCYSPDATGKCSTCSGEFSNAQDFYEHLDDCVLRVVQQGEPSEAIDAVQSAENMRLAEIEKAQSVNETLRDDVIPTTTTAPVMNEGQDGWKSEEDNDHDSIAPSRNIRRTSLPAGRGLTHLTGRVTLQGKNYKKRKDYPSAWGCPTTQMNMKKRVLCVFDGPRRLWKDDMMLDTDYEVRTKLSDGKAYVTDLDVQAVERAEAFQNSKEEEKGPLVVDHDITSMDLEKLVEIKG